MVAFPSILEGIDDLSLGHINQILERAEDFKSGLPPRLPLQKSLAVATSFLEHSTRTKHSFTMAIKRLGGFHIDFHAETSSLKKGESLEQTLLTLHYQGIDVCIIRTQESHLLKQFKEHPPIKIINGGDGSNQHPTQALLDLFTLKQKLGTLEGKTLAIIGDCTHSRVTHSLIDLLPKYGIKVLLVGPSDFLPKEDFEGVQKTQNLNDAIKKADALYLLRIQTERHQTSQQEQDKIKREYNKDWGINRDRLQGLDKFIPIFHPGPANIGVEVDQEIVNSELWMAHKQVQNSVYVRMAIIESIVNNDAQNIGAIYNKISGDIGAGY